MPESLHNHWTKLVEAIREECREHDRHPDLLEVDESTLKVRLPLAATTYHSEQFLPEAVLGGDPAAMAAKFYVRYQEAERDERQVPS